MATTDTSSGNRTRKRSRPITAKAAAACVAVLASLTAAAPSPAQDGNGEIEAAARFSACTGPAQADRGFTDVAEDSPHRAAINCIAYYRITAGTTADTFSPQETITRAQLAVMLHRAAAPAGVDLPTGEASGQREGFADVPDTWRNANQINGSPTPGSCAASTSGPSTPKGRSPVRS